MLVLARKQGQSIFIGDGIEVVVLSVHRQRVRLGFIAPTEVSIDREEVLRESRQYKSPGARRPISR